VPPLPPPQGLPEPSWPAGAFGAPPAPAASTRNPTPNATTFQPPPATASYDSYDSAGYDGAGYSSGYGYSAGSGGSISGGGATAQSYGQPGSGGAGGPPYGGAPAVVGGGSNSTMSYGGGSTVMSYSDHMASYDEAALLMPPLPNGPALPLGGGLAGNPQVGPEPHKGTFTHTHTICC
jgi:hypothetical protein